MKKTKRKTLHRQLAPATLRVMAEYGSSGIWLVRQLGVFRHGMIGYSSLRLPQDLAKRFEQWIAVYESQLDAPLEYDYLAFNVEGRFLAQELKRHVGDSVSVEFQAEMCEGGISAPEAIP